MPQSGSAMKSVDINFNPRKSTKRGMTYHRICSGVQPVLLVFGATSLCASFNRNCWGSTAPTKPICLCSQPVLSNKSTIYLVSQHAQVPQMCLSMQLASLFRQAFQLSQKTLPYSIKHLPDATLPVQLHVQPQQGLCH